MQAEFDRHSSGYEAAVEAAIAFAGQAHEVYVAAKARALVELAARRLRPPLTALDVGCGIGLVDRHLAGHVAALHGVDVSQPMIERARAANPGVEYRTYDGRRLPYPAGAFDLVFAVCVLHHVAPGGRPELVRELRRVARGGGLVVVFEHNPWNPLTRKVVRDCAFDRNVELLSRRDVIALFGASGLHVTDADYVLFSPWRWGGVDALERRLGWLPLGAQYLVAGRPRPGPPSGAHG